MSLILNWTCRSPLGTSSLNSSIGSKYLRLVNSLNASDLQESFQTGCPQDTVPLEALWKKQIISNTMGSTQAEGK